MSEVVIASAARTAIGAFNGGLSSVPAHYLGEVAIRAALERAGVAPEDVNEVIMGQILQAGAGQNPARQAAVNAGIPAEATAYGINQLCGSGLRTVALGFQAIKLGDADVIVAGGQESMSQAPHVINLRGGTKMGSAEMIDSMIKDGLTDAFHGYHMGNTAENVAQRWQLTRPVVAAEGRRRHGSRQVQGRDLPRHHQVAQGRNRGRHGRAPQAWHHGRGPRRHAHRLRQGRHGDRR